MTRLETILAGLVACVLAAGAGSLAGYARGAHDAESKQIKQQAMVDAVEQRMRAVTADEIAKIKVTNKTIQQKVINEVTEKTIYSDCRVPASGVHAANEALAGLQLGDGKLPAGDRN